MEECLKSLYASWCGQPPEGCVRLAQHASRRRRWRLYGPGGVVMGVYHDDVAENRTFVGLAEHFRSMGIPVPKVLCRSLDGRAYLETDLGDVTLYDAIASGEFGPEQVRLYERALDLLLRFQFEGIRGMPADLCPPFDRTAMLADLEYGRISFLDRLQVRYNGPALQRDFARLLDSVAVSPESVVMYRDYQARNLMVTPDGLFGIDFQGSRRGPAAYDVASLLYQSRVKMPQPLRDTLVQYYISKSPVSLDNLPAVVVLRLVQTLGTYGRVGMGTGQAAFVDVIPRALANLDDQLQRAGLPLPELQRVVSGLRSMGVPA